MKKIYAQQPLNIEGESIFVAGPTARSSDVKSWRPEAIELFELLEFDGTLLIPESEDGQFVDFWAKCAKEGYHNQIEWEDQALQQATVIMFWIPRDLVTLPAFTTNVEFGMYLKSGKIVLGSPPEAEKNKYLIHHAEKNSVPFSTYLIQTVENAISLSKKIGFK